VKLDRIMDKRMGAANEVLADILRRKRHENARRLRHMARSASATPGEGGRREHAEAVLRRGPRAALRVIAEIKRRSPSAGVIRPRSLGDVCQIATSYERAGAAAVSVLCDRVGFGGSPLEVRRAAACVQVPVLFKEFVLDPIQIGLARRMGASMVLLLANSLDDAQLRALVAECHRLDMAPVVEVANTDELRRALQTDATIIGVNARDLHTFSVDSNAAALLVAEIPSERIAVFMSGVTTREAFDSVAQGRADAVLIGEGLMRASDPGAKLAELLRS